MEQDIQRPLNEIFILCVGKGCGFVQQNDGCILEDRTRQRNALHLAAGKIDAPGSDDGIYAVGEFFQDILALRLTERFHDLFP